MCWRTAWILVLGHFCSHRCTLSDHAFVAAGATLGGNVKIGEQAFIGVGAVLRDNLAVAERSFIGAGAVVVADTEADGVYAGNPAGKTGRTALEVTAGRSSSPATRAASASKDSLMSTGFALKDGAALRSPVWSGGHGSCGEART